VAADAELDRVVAKYVNDLLTSGPEAVAAAKRLIADVASRPRDGASQFTAEATAERRVSSEGQDGMKAFLEKRLPSWHSSGS
jgi:methylglutaconyl-CoA hydratase